MSAMEVDPVDSKSKDKKPRFEVKKVSNISACLSNIIGVASDTCSSATRCSGMLSHYGLGVRDD